MASNRPQTANARRSVVSPDEASTDSEWYHSAAYDDNRHGDGHAEIHHIRLGCPSRQMEQQPSRWIVQEFEEPVES